MQYFPFGVPFWVFRIGFINILEHLTKKHANQSIHFTMICEQHYPTNQDEEVVRVPEKTDSAVREKVHNEALKFCVCANMACIIKHQW